MGGTCGSYVTYGHQPCLTLVLEASLDGEGVHAPRVLHPDHPSSRYTIGTMMTMQTLVLNQDFTPLEVISWQSAMSKFVRGKVEVVEGYEGRVVRSPSVTFPLPAVVRNVGKFSKRKVRFSRKNILARDAYTCQYCGVRPKKSSGAPDLSELTIDHVVPRAQSVDGWVVLPWNKERVRVSSWENVLTACYSCNTKKADRRPDQAGLKMSKTPKPPSTVDIAWMGLFGVEIPEEWKSYLPANSPWREYWDVPLDPS